MLALAGLRMICVIALGLAIVCLPLSGCGTSSGPASEQHSLVGKQAPLFTAQLLDGAEFDLAQHQGKVVILDFWATWCGPCRAALPTISEVAAEFRSRGVEFYAVDLDEAPEDVSAFVEQSGLDLTVVMDQGGKIAGLYEVDMIPQTVILDGSGKIRFVHVGTSNDLRQRLQRELNELTAGVEPPPANAAEEAPQAPKG